MPSKLPWKIEQAQCRAADSLGEEIARLHGFEAAPIDPFAVADSERAVMHLAGDDFGEAFDGRLSYVGPRYLLCFNTKYDRLPHEGVHHPRVRFSVAHELGHFYIDDHRQALARSGTPHGSFSEFASNNLIERQADAFAAGLLMPRYLLRPRVNDESDPTIESIRKVASTFQVSLVGAMVRWVQLSDFPCAAICLKQGKISWGFISEAFRSAGLGRLFRDHIPDSSGLASFISMKSEVREKSCLGSASAWFDFESNDMTVQEHFVTLAYNQSVMAFLTADENDLIPVTDDEAADDE